MHLLPQVENQPIEVRLAQPFVAVGQNRQADRHVWVRKLGRRGRNILPDERHSKQRPGPRHSWVRSLGPLHVQLAEEAEGDAVDLAHAERHKGSQPVPANVEDLQALVAAAVVDLRFHGATSALHQILVRDVVRHLFEPRFHQPQHQPFGEQRPQLLVVVAFV